MALEVCKGCREPADEVEIAMYDGICEKCERLNHERLQAWRAGADDDFYDMFWKSFVSTVH